MNQFSEEQMGSRLHGSAESAQYSLHGLYLETLLDHDMVIIFLKAGDLETPQEHLKRQRTMAKERGRRRRVKKKNHLLQRGHYISDMARSHVLIGLHTLI